MCVYLLDWDDEDFAANILEFLLEKKKSKECSVGRAVVSTSGDGCPSSEAGKSATGKARGTTHADCTKAKHIARANLRAKVPRACHKYITSTPPCKIVKC